MEATTDTTTTYTYEGVVYEDSGMGMDRPVGTVPGLPVRLAALLFAIADLAVSLSMGHEYVAETYAEAGSGAVSLGFDRYDANTTANEAVRDARARLAMEEAQLASLEAQLAAEFPQYGPEAPAPALEDTYEPF